MSLNRIMVRLVVCALFLSLTPDVQAYMVDIGYSALQSELGAAIPTGAGVRVAQVEAPINDVSGVNPPPPIFMPDPSHSEFIGKTITAITGNLSGSFSGHATSVGQLFYGATSSIAPGITQIDSYEANNWLNSLHTPSGAATTSHDQPQPRGQP